MYWFSHRRAILRAVFAITSMTALLLWYHLSEQKASLQVCSATPDVWSDITGTRKHSAKPLLSKLSLNGYELAYDSETDSYLYSRIEGSTDTPGFSWNAPGISVATDRSMITPKMVSKNTPIRVLTYSRNRYHISRLYITSLPVIDMTIKGIDDASELTADDTQMKFSLFDNRKGAPRRSVQSEGTAHLRGGTSLRFPKKGVKIKLYQDSVGGHKRENELSLLGMRQDGDWILYPGYNDREKIRNVFSTNLWYDTCAKNNSLGIKNGDEYRYVELFMNNRYWGLYAIGTPIDGKQLSLKENTKQGVSDTLFKKINWAESETDKRLRTPEDSGYVLKYSREPEEKAYRELWQYFDSVNSAKTPEEIRDMTDEDNLIDLCLFLNLIQGRDNWMKNMYLSMIHTGDHRLALYTPWDLDLSWGNRYNHDSPNLTTTYGGSVKSPWNTLKRSPLGKRIELGDQTVKSRLNERYQSLRRDAWSDEAVITLLNDYESEIYDSGAYVRDLNRWPKTSRQDPENKLSSFKTYVLERLAYLDQTYR